mmetsp:Transcript_28017/g.61738  ORF Transcript_28017/g.61738 Transcript_28017/m.61738 type:complete len:167 (+) Transcript_28017:56-556(+)|eukprot:CAMPEP_0168184614 /NCGR_PEP_ID=MMETSP0139_2-20121125/13342_1 /TAXON_ID=44445 /ORGANISM="Pseudo-nitzschia australis, Strain 10249 10 AB" /LENGTH=166 /DNA_ID=CAMNT_0008106265 /DNA_START=22 /DNA_END=522 /DNA_ORIENTATION=-
MAAFQYKRFVILVAIICGARTNAYTSSHDHRRSFGVKHSSPSAPSLFGLQHAGSSSQENNIRGNKGSSDSHLNQRSAGLSQAAMNTDAGFAGPSRRLSAPPHGAAHGILSPEIVARMDENTVNGRSNPAVENFLLTYKRKGPMSCLEMLSDPDVLPHLTQAMRDIV